MIEEKEEIKIGSIDKVEEAGNYEKKNDGRKKEPSYFFELIKVVIWALVIIIPVRTFLFQPFFVQGASMEPNFYDGEYLIVNEFGYKETNFKIGSKQIFSVKPHKDLQRGDIIVFRYPKKPSEFFIKRIVGLPEEKVELKSGQVTIYNSENPEGFILDETGYIPSVQRTDCLNGKDRCSFETGEDEYLVFGDNRNHSSDSRSWGILPKSYVMGKVLLRAWPIDKFSIF